MRNPLKIALFIEQGSAHTRGIARGVSLYAQTHGPWVFSTLERPENAKLIISPLDNFEHIDSDGVIIYTHDEEVLQKLLRSGRPVVNTTQTATPHPQVTAAFTDDQALGRMVADYFINRGFKEFAFCGSCLGSSPCSIQRGTGFSEQVKGTGFSSSSFPSLDHPPREIIWEQDQEEIAQWIKSLKRPLALFADNDSCGRVIADICRKQSIHVPEDVAIIGVNNDDLICEFSNPHLSSVTLAKEQVGFEAASLLEQLIRKKKPPAHPVLVPPRGITTRRSSDIFAVEDPHVAKALNFIYTHAGESIRVTDVLKEVPLCRRYLEVRFRKALGRSPYDEIRRAHVERAKKLLAETNLPLDQIVTASGFNEIKNFYANFRKETTLSPIQYRKQFKVIGRPDSQ